MKSSLNQYGQTGRQLVHGRDIRKKSDNSYADETYKFHSLFVLSINIERSIQHEQRKDF